MKNLIIFIPAITNGGMEKNFFSTTKNLKKGGVNILGVSCSKKKFKKKIKLKKNYGLLELDNLNFKLKLVLSFFVLIFKNFKQKNPVLSYQGNIFAIIACKIIGCKVYIRLNSHPNYYIDSNLKKIFFHFFYKYANEIIVNSKEVKNVLKNKFNLRSTIIYNELDKNNIIKKSKKKVNIKFSNSYPILISVGRLDKNKNHIFLIEAFNNLKKKIKYNLIILGSGNENQYLLNKIYEYKLNNYIKIINFKNNPYPYIRKSKFFILPSKIEGYPNVLLEAGALGKLIISNNISGAREIIEYDKRGYLFGISSYSKFYKVLKKIKNKETNKTKIKNLKMYIKNRHLVDHSKNYIKLIFTK